MACPGLATHRWQGCMHCGCRVAPQRLENFSTQQKCTPQCTTCPAWWPHLSVQAPPYLLHTAEAAFDHALACCMPRAGQSHTGRALCTVAAERHLCIWKTLALRKTANPYTTSAQLGRSSQCRLHHTCFTLQRPHLTWQHLMVSPGLATHTPTGLCTLWLPSGASSTEKLQKAAKP